MGVITKTPTANVQSWRQTCNHDIKSIAISIMDDEPEK